jgi:hypothetical protein
MHDFFFNVLQVSLGRVLTSKSGIHTLGCVAHNYTAFFIEYARGLHIFVLRKK